MKPGRPRADKEAPRKLRKSAVKDLKSLARVTVRTETTSAGSLPGKVMMASNQRLDRWSLPRLTPSSQIQAFCLDLTGGIGLARSIGSGGRTGSPRRTARRDPGRDSRRPVLRHRTGRARRRPAGRDRCPIGSARYVRVPTVGRNREIVGIEDGDLDSAILDRRAPVGSGRIAKSELPRSLIACSRRVPPLCSSSTPSVTMNSTSCGVSLGWLVPLPGLGMELAWLSVLERIVIVGGDVAARRGCARRAGGVGAIVVVRIHLHHAEIGRGGRPAGGIVGGQGHKLGEADLPQAIHRVDRKPILRRGCEYRRAARSLMRSGAGWKRRCSVRPGGG